MNISIIGLGKLGLPFAFFLASLKNKILCFDKNKKIINLIKTKETKIVVDCWGLLHHIQKPFKIYNWVLITKLILKNEL